PCAIAIRQNPTTSTTSNRGSRKFYHTTSVGISEVPALGVRDQEISENLNTCDRLEFFRINKISVERERVGFAEQLNQAAVFLDQIVRQNCDTESALARAQNAK